MGFLLYWYGCAICNFYLFQIDVKSSFWTFLAMISLRKLARAIHQPFYGFLNINANSATQKKSAQLVTSLHTSSFNARWHKDKVENRDLYRHGYVDRVKQSGALPRISEDSPRVKEIKVFRPSNPFAPKEALFGQNDYIDILGRYKINIRKQLVIFSFFTNFSALKLC